MKRRRSRRCFSGLSIRDAAVVAALEQLLVTLQQAVAGEDDIVRLVHPHQHRLLAGEARDHHLLGLLRQVIDDLGNPVAGRVVRFAVSRNSGTLQLTPSDTPKRVVLVPTSGSGRASALFTLGDTAGEGNNRVQVTLIEWRAMPSAIV